MSQWQPFSFDPSEFSGVARLFPLPNLVLFPHVVQPLHVFEPRYRLMLENALADDQLLSLALLEPGWEQEYENRPAVAPIGCLGRILTHTALDDGGYNLLLVGVQRVRIRRELPPTQPFRLAEVALAEDEFTPGGEAGRAARRRELLKAFRRFVPKSHTANEQFEQLLVQHVSLGMLTDIMGYTLNFEFEFKRRLLLELNIDRRAEMLLRALSQHQAGSLEPSPPEEAAGAGRPFPPDFSLN